MQFPVPATAGAIVLIMSLALSGRSSLADGPLDAPEHAPTDAVASAPMVATDIPPVHALVARVMQDVAEPALIVPPGASPHGHNMRPSEAAALDRADLVIWMGPLLTPWLEQAIRNLAGDAHSLVLLDTQGTLLLPYRDEPRFEAHMHDDAHGHDDEHGHGNIDPHAWLDPQNAQLWLGAIADTLAEIDPSNAAAYRANAEAGEAEIAALATELAEELAPVRERPFIVFHDAYHYFEHRFGVEARGAIAYGDAAPPGPGRISEMRALVADSGSTCVFAEPQFPSGLVATIIEGTAARSAVLDPLGMTLAPGPELYPQLLHDLADALRSCLAPEG